MNERVNSWLNAYHDGELSIRRWRQVEQHLQICADCKAHLEEIQAISMLLDDVPSAEDLLPNEVFVAQVGMRLPREDNASLWNKISQTGWRAAPFGLLGSWALVQAIFIVSNLVLWALRIVPGADQIMALLPSGGSSPVIVTGLSGLGILRAGQLGASLFGGNSFLGWSLIFNVGITMLIGLLYWSWLASWWIRTNGNHMLNGTS